MTKELCAVLDGFTLHAVVRIRSGESERLEHLCRYVTRPPLSTQRLSLLADGRVVHQLRAPFRDGTTHLMFDPLVFLERLAALGAGERGAGHGAGARAAAGAARVLMRGGAGPSGAGGGEFWGGRPRGGFRGPKRTGWSGIEATNDPGTRPASPHTAGAWPSSDSMAGRAAPLFPSCSPTGVCSLAPTS